LDSQIKTDVDATKLRVISHVLHKVILFCLLKSCKILIRDKGKAVPLQAQRGPEGFRKLRVPDFMTTQDGGGLSALRTGRLYPQEILLVPISVRG